jgi:hypothetical protein
MMVIVTTKYVNMQRNATGLGEALQAMGDHLCSKGADAGILEVKGADEEGARRDVDHGPCEGLVQGRIGVSESCNARAVSKRLVEGRSEREKRVFRCVVIVNWDGLVHGLAESWIGRHNDT